MSKQNKFSPEVRERAVRLVQEHRGEYPSLWAAVESIAPKIGCVPATLLDWVKRSEIDSGMRDGMTSSERERMKALERENKELRRANEILKSASAFFAQAALDREWSTQDVIRDREELSEQIRSLGELKLRVASRTDDRLATEQCPHRHQRAIGLAQVHADAQSFDLGLERQATEVGAAGATAGAGSGALPAAAGTLRAFGRAAWATVAVGAVSAGADVMKTSLRERRSTLPAVRGCSARGAGFSATNPAAVGGVSLCRAARRAALDCA